MSVVKRRELNLALFSTDFQCFNRPERLSYHDFTKGLAKTGGVTIFSLDRFRGRCFSIPKFSGNLFFNNNH